VEEGQEEGQGARRFSNLALAPVTLPHPSFEDPLLALDVSFSLVTPVLPVVTKVVLFLSLLRERWDSGCCPVPPTL
jgi:hypothetical protein